MLSSLLYKWRNWLEWGLMLLHITQLENNINGSDAWAFWIYPLPAIALYNSSFKDIELSVSRKGTCKAFTGTKSGEKKKISNSGQKKIGVSHYCQRTCWQRAKCLSDMDAGMIPGTTCLYLVWHHRFKVLCVRGANAWHPCTGLLVFATKGFSSLKKDNLHPCWAKCGPGTSS